MPASLDIPKVFISYSWNPATNKEKTIELANRLTAAVIHVIIDEWDLTPGQDKYAFMEKMVNDPEIKKVLIICNEDYAKKANNKTGGVGTESLIISNEIYSLANQNKFIPVIFEKDSAGKAFVPTFVHSRIYIDLSTDEYYEEQFEKLIRDILDKPASKRPAYGTRPAYLEENEPIFLATAHKVRSIKSALIAEKKNVQVFIDDYYSAFIQALKSFEISDDESKKMQEIDELIMQKIESLKNLRNDFVDFLETLFTYSHEINIDKFERFFEDFLDLLLNHEKHSYPANTIGVFQIDHFKFFLHELFLYTTAVMLKKERFVELAALLHQDFVIYLKDSSGARSVSFTRFRNYVESLERHRQTRLQSRRVSITADLIKQRADITSYNFDLIRECDVLLYYVSLMKPRKSRGFGLDSWFPVTTVYDFGSYSFFRKLISKRQFEKVKSVFAVNTIDELKNKVEELINSNPSPINDFNFRPPSLHALFDFSEIGTLR